MKIIHLISGGDVGGAKTHVLSLLHGLKETERVRLVCFTDGDFASEARDLGIDTRIVSSGNLRAVVKILRDMISEEDFQIVHCHGSRANLVGSLLRRKIGAPVVTTVHSDYRLDYLGRPLGRLTYGTINTVALRFLDYYIGVSRSMGDILISRGFDPQRIFAIYNGVDFTPRTPQMDREAFLASLGLDCPADGVVFGIAARLSAVKDVGTLIRAFAAAAKENPRIRLIIAGDGEQRQDLERLAAQICPAGSCVFAGWVSDMDSFYGALDVNVLTSLSETFPYALTEGARMGCATVASNVGGVPDLIEDGVCGLLFEAKDVSALTEHIASLAADKSLRERLGQALYDKARREFSVEATVEKQKEIYETILRRSRRNKKRDGVMICGAYGRGNAGDDAILECIVGQMRQIDPDLPLYVLSRTPRQTAARHRMGAIYTFNFPRFCRVARTTNLYINGGGSLIQDVTSSRSLWYYLLSIAAAKRRGNKVLMYGCGIGPVIRERNRRLAGRVLNRNVDVITLRDNFSMEELRRMNVTEPERKVTADPGILLRPAAEAAVEAFLRRRGIDPDVPFALFAIRSWKGMEDALPAFVAAAEHTAAAYGLRPVYLAMEPRSDREICRQAMERTAGSAVLEAPEDSALLIGVLRKASLVVAMRLHALVFAAGAGVPLTGVAYDPKVTAFLDYLGRPDCLALETLTAEGLTAEIDAVLADGTDHRGRAERLRSLAEENQAAAAKLLEEKQ